MAERTQTETPDASTSQPIVVGVDGSNASAGALKRAARIARALDADLVAVSAWEPPKFYGGYVVSEWSPEADARLALNDTIASVFGTDLPPRFRTEVNEGSPSHVLLNASKNAQMLVVGSRGHGGFGGLLLGSVSSACAEYAHCPVLVYHGEPIEVHYQEASTEHAS